MILPVTSPFVSPPHFDFQFPQSYVARNYGLRLKIKTVRGRMLAFCVETLVSFCPALVDESVGVSCQCVR